MSKKEREYANSKWILRNLFFRKAVYVCCVSIRDQRFNNFDYSRRRQNDCQVTFVTGVKRQKVGSPFSLTLFLP